MNNTTAIATLEQARQKTAPPLKKDEVLKATAQAMAEEHEKGRLAAMQNCTKASAAFDDACFKYALKNVRKLIRLKAERWIEVNGKSVYHHGLFAGVDISTVPELLEKKRAYDQARLLIPKQKTYSDFLGELRAAAAGKRSPNIEALLADTKLRKQLLAAGKQLLATPTEADKANASAA